jgi:ligand-binding sensor domain-containing protein
MFYGDGTYVRGPYRWGNRSQVRLPWDKCTTRSRGAVQGIWGKRPRGLWAMGEENVSAMGPAR